ncbi:hypothetical protein ACH4E7_32095 [Kitasatospora sp. NPDC018058]
MRSLIAEFADGVSVTGVSCAGFSDAIDRADGTAVARATAPH